MREESVFNLILTPDLEARVAVLRKKAEQVKLVLPTDVALYIAQNVRSSASALEGALVRLMAHSSVTGTEITLKYTQQVLANFIAAEASRAALDPLQKLLSQPIGPKSAQFKRPHPTEEDEHFVFCLLGIRDERKTSRARRELQVNMRESERERLARRDVYERELERRAKKRKQG
ncbi:MAG: DnaA/Hda family protein [Candidatus Sulfotelmatobacter sp.]